MPSSRMGGEFEWELLPIQSPVLTPNLDGMQRRQGSRQSFRIRREKTGRKEDKQSQGKERKVKRRGRRQKAMKKEEMGREGAHQAIVP